MAQGLVNIKGVTKKEIEELQQMLNDLNKLIGDAANTGGTTTVRKAFFKHALERVLAHIDISIYPQSDNYTTLHI